MEQTRKFTWKELIVVASMLFGMYFGASNLTFPVQIGQQSGSAFISSIIGFIITGTILPLLGVAAIAITRTHGVFELAQPIGKTYALIFTVILYIAIGPAFATPRTATVPFEFGIATHVSAASAPFWLLIYSACFFTAVIFLSLNRHKVVDYVGRYLNPAFIIMVVILIAVAIFKPMGTTAGQAVTGAWRSGSTTNGIIQGYQTMDALASVEFGIVVITAIKALGVKKESTVAHLTVKAGIIAASAMAVIYTGLAYIGATSLGHFKIAADGGIALGQITQFFFGNAGVYILAIMATITCLTTAVGVTTSFATAFSGLFPKFGYKTYVIAVSIISFGVSNFGFATIIAIAMPFLMFIYPLCITLILLSLASPLFHRARVVYICTTIFTIVPALIDGLNAGPAFIAKSAFVQALTGFESKYVPFFAQGFAWLVPAIIGFVIGIGVYEVKRVRVGKTVSETE
ncbi:branched-chain amino acid transport system II carrier protein [Secundilactobacillus malefermentans]|uniref:branched-chain amino acid transport system II carrier protein n=1 Tax=Secundilactobacillus malefermentans TaxID=176292 RepID=UPI0011CC3435|nr:branched-chain amino acid transport system II carrier protein [Secundilactobacillus malefermentans]QEA31384.1 branched-chain amino acid transport system II carrier protein [Secundilactobacillus malefermentans]